jgi:hypothetical protein
MCWPELLFSDRQSTLVTGLDLRVLALREVKHRQIVKISSNNEMLRTQGLFIDRQCSLLERLDLIVPTTNQQVRASIIEQSRSLEELEVPLADQFHAGVSVGYKPFAERPCRKLRGWKCAAYGPNGAFRPRALRRLVDSLLQHGLHQAVDLKRAGVRNSAEQGIFKDLCGGAIKRKRV